MPDGEVWLITGASRGMGAALTRAALAAGNAVVATGRRPDKIAMLGASDGLLVVRLDVTSVSEANAAVEAAVERFGRIDVLVNNAGVSFKGYFEEMSPEQVEQQLATNLLGPMIVTRAVLPVMRRQQCGHVISISSGAGLVAFEYSSVYAASKFGLEGWMGALEHEVAPFGIRTTIVNPGFFRTGLAIRSRSSGRTCRSLTMPSAAPRSGRGGGPKTANSPAIPGQARQGAAHDRQ
jgi:NAD(P)-dependent dehydrogenase (short-subunit alcohol dehydrogenase family)